MNNFYDTLIEVCQEKCQGKENWELIIAKNANYRLELDKWKKRE